MKKLFKQIQPTFIAGVLALFLLGCPIIGLGQALHSACLGNQFQELSVCSTVKIESVKQQGPVFNIKLFSYVNINKNLSDNTCKSIENINTEQPPPLKQKAYLLTYFTHAPPIA